MPASEMPAPEELEAAAPEPLGDPPPLRLHYLCVVVHELGRGPNTDDEHA